MAFATADTKPRQSQIPPRQANDSSAIPVRAPLQQRPAPAGPLIAAIPAMSPAPRPAQPRQPAINNSAARSMVLAIVQRLEAYIEEETTALAATSNFDFKTSNDRKSQGLVDLNQAMRRLTKADVDKPLQQRLAEFRAKLTINLETIKMHLNAVKEISGVLSQAIQSAESDGTYTRANIGPYRNAP